MREKRIGNAKITFCVFKVNRIDFLRHGRRTYLTLNYRLFENAVTDIAPDILGEIDQNRIGQTQGVEIANPVIVWQDLSRHQIWFKIVLRNKFFAKSKPVYLRDSGLQRSEERRVGEEG